MKVSKTINKLNLDKEKILKARKDANDIVSQVDEYINTRSTVTVERTVLRLFGVEWYCEKEQMPYVNIIVNYLQANNLIDKGAAYHICNAMLNLNKDLKQTCEMIVNNEINLKSIEQLPTEVVKEKAMELANKQADKIAENVKIRNDMIKNQKEDVEPPYLYLIVATGNIYEDTIQAQNAARAGADIIAVIRSTAQSLLDYVPHGATTEGFGGTFATQENFKIMRKGLDEVYEETGKYVHLVNYCSGLCMPEIAAMGALERLDMMLNDSMYGILFRDINMLRTFIDQYFSRMINSYADIVINTGEDNYLTTSDGYEKAHTVLASEFINEQFALKALLPKKNMGLGHAFEMNPKMKNQFVYELSQAQMAKEIFPEAPLKYMPPTKYMTGNIFKGHVQDAMFNSVAIMTGQTIQLLGMMTEAIHTPFMMDRHLAVENAKMVFNTMRDLQEEIEFKKDGKIQKRAHLVLDNALQMLNDIKTKGLTKSISDGDFADIKRPIDGGKGKDGVFLKGDKYFNPFEEIFSERLRQQYGDLDKTL